MGLVTLTAFAFDIALFINVGDKARQARQGLPDPQVRYVVAPGLARYGRHDLSFSSLCTANL